MFMFKLNKTQELTFPNPITSPILYLTPRLGTWRMVLVCLLTPQGFKLHSTCHLFLAAEGHNVRANKVA